MNIKKLLVKAENLILSSKYEESIKLLDKIVEHEPTNIRFLNLRSEAYLRLEWYEKALPDLAKVVGIDNKNKTALNNFGVALLKCKKYNEAKDILEYLVELQPSNLEAQINLCNIYQALGEPEVALKTALRAIELNLTSAPAFNNLGTALAELAMIKEASEAYLTALDLDPKYIPSIINLCEIEAKQENYENAITHFENALKVNQLSRDERDLIQYYLSYSYLSTGRIEEGWKFYEFGLKHSLPKGAGRSNRKFSQGQWDGNLAIKSKILIWSEQGLGDEILFSSCLEDLHLNDLSVILECDHRMIGLYKRTYPKFDVRTQLAMPSGFHILNDFELQCSMGSLANIFRKKIDDFPKNIRPISIDQEINLKVKFLIEPLKNKKIIGICWRSGNLSVGRNINYTSLLDWGPIFKNKNEYNFINLQYGDCEDELIAAEEKFGITIHRWQGIDLKNDLESVYAIISNLNLVVTVGTAVSTIAGSINIETHLMMKRSWLLLGENKKFPWFPTIKPYVAEPSEHVGTLINEIEKNI